MVRRLARLVAHEIEIRSVPARSSTFAIESPLASFTQLPAAKDPPALTADAIGTVLEEDEVLVRMGLHTMVEGWRYQVLSTGALAEAL